MAEGRRVPGRHRARRAALAAVMLALAAALTACGSGGGGSLASIQTVDNGDWKGAYLEQPYLIPPVSLSDTEGRPYTLATSPAAVKIVFFGYTKCPDICQITMSTIAQAVAHIPKADQSRVQVVFVTTDPARDTGPVLRSYLDRFGHGFVGLTDPLPVIMKLATPMKVYVSRGQKLPSGGYEVDHATYVFGVVGNGVKLIWDQGTSPAQMAADMIKLLKT